MRDTLKWRKPWRADMFPEGKPYLTSAALEASGIDMFKCMCAEGDLVRVSGGESVAYIADINRNSTSKTYRYKSRYICPNKGVAQHDEIHMRLVQPKRQSALYSTVQHTDGYPIASQKSVCASEVVREQQSGRRCSISEHERTRNVDCNARRTKSVQSIKKTSHKNDTTNRKQKPPQVEPKLAKEMGETRRDLKKRSEWTKHTLAMK